MPTTLSASQMSAGPFPLTSGGVKSIFRKPNSIQHDDQISRNREATAESMICTTSLMLPVDRRHLGAFAVGSRSSHRVPRPIHARRVLPPEPGNDSDSSPDHPAKLHSTARSSKLSSRAWTGGAPGVLPWSSGTNQVKRLRRRKAPPASQDASATEDQVRALRGDCSLAFVTDWGDR